MFNQYKIFIEDENLLIISNSMHLTLNCLIITKEVIVERAPCNMRYCAVRHCEDRQFDIFDNTTVPPLPPRKRFKLLNT